MKLHLGIFIAGIAAGGLLVYKLLPQQAKTDTRVIYQDRVQTVTKEVVRTEPGGVQVIEREIVRNEARDKTETRQETKPLPRKNWIVGLSYDITPDSVQSLTFGSITAQVNRRVFGDVYVGVTFGQNAAGLNLLYSF